MDLILAENDTLFTGLSGVIIFIIVLWLVLRAIRQRG
jgi:hypothetical protein